MKYAVYLSITIRLINPALEATPAQYQWISVHNTRIYSIRVFIGHQFNLCNKTIPINATTAARNVCVEQWVLPGQTFRYSPPLGSALQTAADKVVVMVWDPKRDVLLQKEVNWGTVLQYPLPDFPYVEKNSNQ
jgi:hypothetical protein